MDFLLIKKENYEGKIMIKISVIIPIFNREIYLNECIESVLSQTLKNIEVICVDDGSDDMCVNILKKYKEKYENVQLIRKHHEGAWAARNTGIKAAKGEYICFIDSDDYYANEDSLKVLYYKAKEKQAVICGGNIVNVFSDGHQEPRGEQYAEDGMHLSYIDPQMTGHTRYIYKRDFLLKNNLFYFPYKRYEDPPFVLKTFLTAKQYYVVDRVIYCARQYQRDKRYPYDVVCDLVKGLLECYLITKQYNLKNFCEKGLKLGLHSIYANSLYYVYKGDKTICSLLNRINQIQMELTGQELWIKDEISAKEVFNSAKKVLYEMENAQKIIIYGGGYVGERLLLSGLLNKEKVIGFAVTKRMQKTQIYGFKVYELSELLHEKEAYIVIAVSKDKRDEMENYLKQLGYYNYGHICGEEIFAVESILSQMKDKQL